MEIQPLPTSPYSTTTTTTSSSTITTTTTTIINNNNSNSNPPPATTTTNANTNTNTNNNNPMQMWWESISKARSHIHALSSLLPPHRPSSSSSISSLADTDRPALSLLSSKDAYSSVSSSLSSSPSSGSGHDPICQWLYDTLLSPDPDLRLFPLSLLPHLSSLYLSRLHSSPSSSSCPPPSFSGFEAVLLALYSSEVKSRAGKPVLVSVPDLSLPSLYHTPRPGTPNSPRPPPPTSSSSSSAGVLCPPLEPQLAVKSTKRASVIAVTLDCYYRKISLMPPHSKLDFCRFASSWAGHHCPCRHDLDDPNIDNDNALSANSDEIVPEEEDDAAETDTTTSTMMTMSKLVITEGRDGEVEEASDSSLTVACRVPLPWELMQPMLRILGHCLLGPSNLPEVRNAASEAVRALYARAMHEVVPQAILASRSLIRLDNSMRLAEKKAAEAAAAAAATSASNPNTPTKPRKPEILLMSK